MKFELEKTVQALNYIIHSCGLNHIDKLDALKLIFLADRYHLRKYGRMITNDEYWAMTYGPVASSVKDVVEIGDFLSSSEKYYTEKYLEKYNKHQLKSIAFVDSEMLSKSDIEALDAAIEQKTKQLDLVAFTHLFPEWKKHALGVNTLNYRTKMNMIDCFEHADAEIEYCVVPEELLALNKEHYCDTLAFDNLWS